MSTTYESLPMNTLPVRVRKFVDHNSRNRVHWHDEIEILYFIKGEGVISCNLKEYNVKKGDIVFINGKELHTGCMRGYDSVYYCIHVNTEFFHNKIGNEYIVFCNIINDKRCQELLESIIDKTQETGYKSMIAVKKSMYELLSVIGESYVSSAMSEETYKKQFKSLDTFNSAIEYIDRNFDKDLSVRSIANHFFLSSSYFAHLFKMKANKGVIEYINELRISHAKSLLEKENLSISEIACRVGFDDINYFSRKFKVITGMTPSKYKSEYIKNAKKYSPKNTEEY